MKNKINFYAKLILLAITFLAFGSAAQAQSTDTDNPTALTTTTIEGEGDGKGETVYFSFTATKGDVKVTVDAKTDYYSTPLRVTLMDTDGKELLPIYIVAKDAGQRETATKHFVREQKVIVRITTQDDKNVKLLTYKIKLEGAVKVETPPAETTETMPTTDQTTSSTSQTTDTNSTATPNSEQTPTKTTTKEKVKNKAKKEAKKIVDGFLDN